MKGLMLKIERKIDEGFAFFTNNGVYTKGHLKAEGRVRPGKRAGYNYVLLYMRNGRDVDTIDMPSPEQLRQCATLLLRGHVVDMGGARQVLKRLLRGLRGDPAAQLLASQL